MDKMAKNTHFQEYVCAVYLAINIYIHLLILYKYYGKHSSVNLSKFAF